jgi:hypothetical protein
VLLLQAGREPGILAAIFRALRFFLLFLLQAVTVGVSFITKGPSQPLVNRLAEIAFMVRVGIFEGWAVHVRVEGDWSFDNFFTLFFLRSGHVAKTFFE